MCETLSLDFVDIILSFIIFGLNIIYIIWGWLMPNNEEREGEAMSAAREELKEVIQKLQSYTNFVTYSDSIALTVKILLLMLIRYWLCKKKNNEERVEDPEPRRGKVQSGEQEEGTPFPGSESHESFMKPKLFNFNIFPTKRTNIVEV